VVVVGGSIKVNGTVEEDVVIIGGVIALGSEAVVEGDVVTVGGSLQQADGAEINGQVIDAVSPEFTIDNSAAMLPAIETLAAPKPPQFDFNFNPLESALSVFGQAFLLALLAAVVVAFIPVPTQRIGQAVSSQPLVAGGLGCLTALVAPVALIFLGLLTFTVILAPLTISLIGIGAIMLAVALIFGEMAIGLEVGQRLVKSFRAEWPLPLSAAMGTFLTVLIVQAVGQFLWCFGWWAPMLLSILAVGGVLMTRFGTRAAMPPVDPSGTPAQVSAPEPPLPPAS